MTHRGAGQDPPGRANGVYGVDDGKRNNEKPEKKKTEFWMD